MDQPEAVTLDPRRSDFVTLMGREYLLCDRADGQPGMLTIPVPIPER